LDFRFYFFLASRASLVIPAFLRDNVCFANYRFVAGMTEVVDRLRKATAITT
jgi:hypothetical protein